MVGCPARRVAAGPVEVGGVPDAVERASQFAPYCDALLLDSRTHDRLGGTGRTHDWSVSRHVVDTVNVPVTLAGGLRAENVAEAIRVVHPYALDVNSGVDAHDGRKDPRRLREFMSAARLGAGPA